MSALTAPFQRRLASMPGHTRRLVLAGTVGAVAVVALVVAAAGAGVPQQVTLPDWWGPWPTGERSSRTWGAVALIAIGGLCALWVLLGRAWLRPTVDRPVPRLRHLGLVALAWTVPLLVTGPIGSLDVQSYAAVGRLASLGLDPYRFGPGWLSGPYAAAVSPVWMWTPTPYGPVQIAALREVAIVAGGHVAIAVLLIRIMAVLGLAAGAALALRATSPAERVPVLLLVALNPLLLVHVVSGAHLDVFVGALAVLVVLLARADRHVLAMVAAVVACLIKAPGAVLMAYVVLDVFRRTERPLRRTRLAQALGTAALSAGAATVAFPNAFGWVGALTVPGAIRSGLAPSTWLSYLFAGLTGQTSARGLEVATTVARVLLLLGGAALVLMLLWRAAEGSARTAFWGVGWALVALALSGPTAWPWYLTWGLFAAAVGSGLRGRLVLIGLSVWMTLVGGFSGGVLGVVTLVAVGTLSGVLLVRTGRSLVDVPVLARREPALART